MSGLINSGILTNPKTRPFGNALADQGMRFQPTTPTAPAQRDPFEPMPASAPQATPLNGQVAGTSQALTASPAANPIDWDAWSKGDWGQPAAPVPLKGTAPAVAGTSQALTATPAAPDIDWGAWESAKWTQPSPGGVPAPTISRSKAQQYADQFWGDDVVEKRLGRPLTDDEKNQAHEYRQKYEQQYLAGHPEDRDEQTRLGLEQKQAKDNAIRIRPAPPPNPYLGGSTDPDLGGSYAPEPTPETTPPAAPTEGELSNPGTGEETTDKTLHELDNMGADEKATIDAIMKYGGLAPQDFDQFYQNAWNHSERDLNSQYAARGMSNSSDALRALGHSRTDLAAQQSKDEADYAMKSWTNDMSRLATVAGLQGKITDQDLENWGLKQQWTHDAQRLEEGRLGGYLTAEETAFNSLYPKVMAAFGDMTEADQKQVAEIIGSLPAMFQDTANQDTAAQERALGSLAEILKLYPGGKGVSAGTTTGAAAGK